MSSLCFYFGFAIKSNTAAVDSTLSSNVCDGVTCSLTNPILMTTSSQFYIQVLFFGFVDVVSWIQILLIFYQPVIISLHLLYQILQWLSLSSKPERLRFTILVSPFDFLIFHPHWFVQFPHFFLKTGYFFRVVFFLFSELRFHLLNLLLCLCS